MNTEAIFESYLSRHQAKRWIDFANKLAMKSPSDSIFFSTLWLILFRPEAPKDSGANTKALIYEYASDNADNKVMKLVWIQQAVQAAYNHAIACEKEPDVYAKAKIHHERMMKKWIEREISD